MLGKVWERVWLEEQLWRGRGGGGGGRRGGGGGRWSLDGRHLRETSSLWLGLQGRRPVGRRGFGFVGLFNVIVVSTEGKNTQLKPSTKSTVDNTHDLKDASEKMQTP